MIPRRTRRIFSLDHNPAESLPGHQSRLAAGCLPRGTNSAIFLLAADHRFAITGHHPSARPLSFPLGCVYVRFFFRGAVIVSDTPYERRDVRYVYGVPSKIVRISWGLLLWSAIFFYFIFFTCHPFKNGQGRSLRANPLTRNLICLRCVFFKMYRIKGLFRLCAYIFFKYWINTSR